MTNILITGGSGFIGTHVVQHLIDNAADCRILSLDIVPPKIEAHRPFWQRVDICDKDALRRAVTDFQPTMVIHLAARTDLRGKTLEDYRANTLGVANLLEILDACPHLQRAIFTSSMYVCQPGYHPHNFEDYKPHTLYGESKVQTEELIKKADPHYTWAIMRPTSIWGPYFGEPYDKFFRIVLSHAYFHLGKRACKKTYGYVGNAVFQIFSILRAPATDVHRAVFYIGDYAPYDITAWANEIAAAVGIRIPTIPFFLFRIAALFGDFLKLLGITFPMTSFRLHNMTTDNIHDLEPIRWLAPTLPFSREEGTLRTIRWIKNQHKD